ncbi:hypothetical protein RJ641_010736 [Dillenia turbinata]|uniref:Uncharacterized protein n=1 Tax=Dillenia turbinata TaxID=194707 RepID=A0AAN8V6R4_9MAGN
MHGPETNGSLVPVLSLTMKGGSQSAVYDPIIITSTRVGSYFLHSSNELIYCLAVVKGAELNIIGRKCSGSQ